ncbi:hypothetical protein BFW86_14340 [Pseudomonas fluorescens]|nr:hypothetical protein BFW86_14340 [Pseudomonas fluorescens]
MSSLRSKGIYLPLLVAFVLQCGCSSASPEIHRLNVAPADASNQPDVSKLTAGNLGVLVPYYGKDGHFYTAGYVAYLAGYRNTSKLEHISCYTQTPDKELWSLNAVPVAAYGLIPGFWSFRHRVVDGLHSLHGGDAEKVEVRRDRLKQKIISAVQPNSEVPDWQLGFLIHAFGDSYAHVHGAPTKAYSQWIGHLIPSLTGDSPDAIFINDHYKNYNAYVRSLFAALSQGETTAKSDQEGLELFTKEIAAEAAKGNDPDKTVIIHVRHGFPAYDFGANDQLCEKLNVKIEEDEIQDFLKKLSSDLDA